MSEVDRRIAGLSPERPLTLPESRELMTRNIDRLCSEQIERLRGPLVTAITGALPPVDDMGNLAADVAEGIVASVIGPEGAPSDAPEKDGLEETLDVERLKAALAAVVSSPASLRRLRPSPAAFHTTAHLIASVYANLGAGYESDEEIRACPACEAEEALARAAQDWLDD